MERYENFRDTLKLGENREPEFGPVALDLESKTLRIKDTGESVRLTDSEYQVMWLLVRAQGSLLSHDNMVEFLYDDDEERDIPLENVTEVFVSKLRKKLQGIASGKVTIETVRGLGVFLKAH